MEKENGNSCVNSNNIKKMIIKRINENIIKNKTKNISPIKKEKYLNKKYNLSLNNNVNLNLKNNELTKLLYYNECDYYNSGNIFLDNNKNLNLKKTRNVIQFNQKKENFPSRLKPFDTFEIIDNNKNYLKTEYKNSKKNKIFYENNSFDDLNNIFNINNQSLKEETSRKLYLNSNINNNNKQIGNIFLNYKQINKVKNSKRNKYIKNYSNKQNTKKNNRNQFSSEQNSVFWNRNRLSENFWNLSTLEFSILDKTNKINNYNNSLTYKNNTNINNTNSSLLNEIKKCKINYKPFLGRIYKKVVSTYTRRQKNLNQIFHEDNKANSMNEIKNTKDLTDNNINSKILENNKINVKNPSFIYIKNKINKKKNNFSSKSQENIHDNKNKYCLLLSKKKLNKYNYYLKNVKYIARIQKWWKDMIFHMYIEKKIIYIQNKYKIHLKKKSNNINLSNYRNKVNKIIFIQKEWKKYKQNKIKKIDYIKGESYKKNFPKLIPFILDNLEINNCAESIKNINSKNNYKRNKLEKEDNINIHKDIHIEKNVKKKNYRIRNNIITSFYSSKYKIFPKKHNSYNNNCKISKDTITFSIKPTNKKIEKEISILKQTYEKELQKRIIEFKYNYLNERKNKYKLKLIKNISIEINKVFHNNIKEILFQLPINIKCFIEKRYKPKIYKKIKNFKSNCYLSKIRINKFYIIKRIIFIQKNIKYYLSRKKKKHIKKPRIKNYYVTKRKKVINLLDNSNLNQRDIFSFNGNNFVEKSNKDKTNEKEIIDLKRGKNCLYNNVNLFSFDCNNNDINQIIINNNYNLNNFNQLKKLFNKYFIFNFLSGIKYIHKYINIISFINKLKRFLIIQWNKYVFNLLKKFVVKEKQNKDENIIDMGNIDNKDNNIKYIQNESSLISLNENKPVEIFQNNKEELSNYIYNYFYNKKKFTNISLKLIKERLLKCPFKYTTQNCIKKYIYNLYMDIINNKICNICFCKIDEKYDDNCLCHQNRGEKKIQNKGGISIYRQKMNRIINGINNKKKINVNRININIIKNNDENENNENIGGNYNFKIINKINNEKDKSNHIIINRYDTDSIQSRSRSASK